jgi:hypothetical protein
VTIEQSRQLGRLVMAVSGVSLAVFLAGVVRRSYLVLAVPVAILAGATAGLTFWIGYTMATTRWEEDDLGAYENFEVEEAEGVPPPEVVEADYGLRP